MMMLISAGTTRWATVAYALTIWGCSLTASILLLEQILPSMAYRLNMVQRNNKKTKKQPRHVLKTKRRAVSSTSHLVEQVEKRVGDQRDEQEESNHVHSTTPIARGAPSSNGPTLDSSRTASFQEFLLARAPSKRNTSTTSGRSRKLSLPSSSITSSHRSRTSSSDENYAPVPAGNQGGGKDETGDQRRSRVDERNKINDRTKTTDVVVLREDDFLQDGEAPGSARQRDPVVVSTPEVVLRETPALVEEKQIEASEDHDVAMMERTQVDAKKEVSTNAYAAMCHKTNPGEQKVLTGTVILDFDVWTKERNYWGSTESYHLIGAANMDKDPDGTNLEGADQCAAVCAAWPTFWEKSGKALRENPQTSFNTRCTGWTFYHKAAGATPLELPADGDGKWFKNNRGFYAGNKKESKGPACRLFQNIVTEETMAASEHDTSGYEYKFLGDKYGDIQSGSPCFDRQGMFANEGFSNFGDCKEEDYGLFMDWPEQMGGGSPNGGAFLGNAKVFQGNWEDADNDVDLESLGMKWYRYEDPPGQDPASIVFQQEESFQVQITQVSLQDGTGKDITSISGVPRTGQDWEWQYLPDGPGMGYFLCMAWCRITPWCKAMSAGAGSTKRFFALDEDQSPSDEDSWTQHPPDQVHGCWLRDAVGAASLTYLPEWRRNGAEVHSSFKVCPQRDTAQVTETVTEKVCTCTNGVKKDYKNGDSSSHTLTCYADGQEDCKTCDDGYEPAMVGEGSRMYKVCYPTCAGLQQTDACTTTGAGGRALAIRDPSKSNTKCGGELVQEDFPTDQCLSSCCIATCLIPEASSSIFNQTQGLSGSDWEEVLKDTGKLASFNTQVTLAGVSCAENWMPANPAFLCPRSGAELQLINCDTYVDPTAPPECRCSHGGSPQPNTDTWECPAPLLEFCLECDANFVGPISFVETLQDGTTVTGQRCEPECGLVAETDHCDVSGGSYQIKKDPGEKCGGDWFADLNLLKSQCEANCCQRGCKVLVPANPDRERFNFTDESLDAWKGFLTRPEMLPNPEGAWHPFPVGLMTVVCADTYQGSAPVFRCEAADTEVKVMGCESWIGLNTHEMDEDTTTTTTGPIGGGAPPVNGTDMGSPEEEAGFPLWPILAMLALLLLLLLLCCLCKKKKEEPPPPVEHSASEEEDVRDSAAALNLEDDEIIIPDRTEAEQAMLAAGFSPEYSRKVGKMLADATLSDDTDLPRPNPADLAVMQRLKFGGIHTLREARELFTPAVARKRENKLAGELLEDFPDFTVREWEKALIGSGFTEAYAAKLAVQLADDACDPTDLMVRSKDKNDMRLLQLYELGGTETVVEMKGAFARRRKQRAAQGKEGKGTLLYAALHYKPPPPGAKPEDTLLYNALHPKAPKLATDGKGTLLDVALRRERLKPELGEAQQVAKAMGFTEAYVKTLAKKVADPNAAEDAEIPPPQEEHDIQILEALRLGGVKGVKVGNMQDFFTPKVKQKRMNQKAGNKEIAKKAQLHSPAAYEKEVLALKFSKTYARDLSIQLAGDDRGSQALLQTVSENDLHVMQRCGFGGTETVQEFRGYLVARKAKTLKKQHSGRDAKAKARAKAKAKAAKAKAKAKQKELKKEKVVDKAQAEVALQYVGFTPAFRERLAGQLAGKEKLKEFDLNGAAPADLKLMHTLGFGEKETAAKMQKMLFTKGKVESRKKRADKKKSGSFKKKAPGDKKKNKKDKTVAGKKLKGSAKAKKKAGGKAKANKKAKKKAGGGGATSSGAEETDDEHFAGIGGGKAKHGGKSDLHRQLEKAGLSHGYCDKLLKDWHEKNKSIPEFLTPGAKDKDRLAFEKLGLLTHGGDPKTVTMQKVRNYFAKQQTAAHAFDSETGASDTDHVGHGSKKGTKKKKQKHHHASGKDSQSSKGSNLSKESVGSTDSEESAYERAKMEKKQFQKMEKKKEKEKVLALAGARTLAPPTEQAYEKALAQAGFTPEYSKAMAKKMKKEADAKKEREKEKERRRAEKDQEREEKREKKKKDKKDKKEKKEHKHHHKDSPVSDESTPDEAGMQSEESEDLESHDEQSEAMLQAENAQDRELLEQLGLGSLEKVGDMENWMRKKIVKHQVKQLEEKEDATQGELQQAMQEAGLSEQYAKTLTEKFAEMEKQEQADSSAAPLSSALLSSVAPAHADHDLQVLSGLGLGAAESVQTLQGHFMLVAKKKKHGSEIKADGVDLHDSSTDDDDSDDDSDDDTDFDSSDSSDDDLDEDDDETEEEVNENVWFNDDELFGSDHEEVEQKKAELEDHRSKALSKKDLQQLCTGHLGFSDAYAQTLAERVLTTNQAEKNKLLDQGRTAPAGRTDDDQGLQELLGLAKPELLDHWVKQLGLDIREAGKEIQAPAKKVTASDLVAKIYEQDGLTTGPKKREFIRKNIKANYGL